MLIISADDGLPYERPPLSKGFLSGSQDEAGILIDNAGWYRQQRIGVTLQTAIASVDLQKKRLRGISGETVEFETLLIATGARARSLIVPGLICQTCSTSALWMTPEKSGRARKAATEPLSSVADSSAWRWQLFKDKGGLDIRLRKERIAFGVVFSPTDDNLTLGVKVVHVACKNIDVGEGKRRADPGSKRRET